MPTKLAGPEEADRIPDMFRSVGRILKWESAADKFHTLIKYFEQQNPEAHIALNYDTYTDNWASATWSQLYRADEKACNWANQTVLIVFTARDSYPQTDTNLPPVTYLDRLRESRPARHRALSRCLSEVSQWKSVRVRGGPPEDDRVYPLAYLGLYLSEKISRSEFQPVLTAHVDNCTIADSEAHEIEHTITTISENPEPKSALINTLGARIPGLDGGGSDSSDKGVLAESDARLKMATALRAAQWKSLTIDGNRI